MAADVTMAVVAVASESAKGSKECRATRVHIGGCDYCSVISIRNEKSKGKEMLTKR